jgi:hypothetical protein
MADEPISSLTQIGPPTGTPPYPTTFTNPSTGAVLEILDTTNTSMASSGTNSKIAPGDLLKGFLAAGTNVTITETSGIVTIAASGGAGLPGGASNGQVITEVSGAPAWANPVTASYVSAVQSSDYSIVASAGVWANTGLSIAIPGAGTYLILGTLRAGFILNGAIGSTYGWVTCQLYDSTNSAAIPNSVAIVSFASPQVASTNVNFQAIASAGPYVYVASGAAIINLQAQWYNIGATVTSPTILSDSNGYTSLTALRIF